MKTTILLLVSLLITVLIVSEKYNVTFTGALNICAMLVHAFFKQLLAPPKTYYPTGIGYDSNGCFCPGVVEKDFAELGSILDGLFLANHQLINDDTWGYSFKYARVINDIEGVQLYDYIDRKVLGIVQHYLHKLGNNRVSDNISSITLGDNEVTIYLARTIDGENKNANWRNYQRNLILEKNNKCKVDRGPIIVDWNDEKE